MTDHSKFTKKFLESGINVYMSEFDRNFIGVENHHRANTIISKKSFVLGDFKIMPFDVKHDVPCFGFLIENQCNRILFLTDTFYCPYTFSGLTNIIIEANYSKEIIDRKFGSESGLEFLRNRILKSHFSLANCKEMLGANDLSKVNNIVLIHLSDSNSDEIQFQKEVAESTGKNVTVATNGLEISLNKTPF